MTYKQRGVFFGDMAKGGYMQRYEILDDDKVIGSKFVYRKNSNTKQTTTYLLGELEFSTAREFIAAYEKSK